MKRGKVFPIPELKPIAELAFDLGGVRGDHLAAELRKDGVAVFEFEIGRQAVRLVRIDEYAAWLAQRAGFGPAFDEAAEEQ